MAMRNGLINKYRNVKCSYQGIKFDSKLELSVYRIICNRFDNKDIELQPRFMLQDKFTDLTGIKHRKIDYISDFRIRNVVIDVKAIQTETFKIKKKLFLKKYPELRLVLVDKYDFMHVCAIIEEYK